MKISSHPLSEFLSSDTLVERLKKRGAGQTSVEQQAVGPGAGSNAGSWGLEHDLGLLSWESDKSQESKRHETQI